jgi:PPP family 3-phenylpropionic acid transporter
MRQKQVHFRLASFYFVYFLMLGGVAPYFSLYLRKLGFDGVQIGTLLALMPLARVFAPNVWAWIADRQGARRPLVRMATAAAALSLPGC